MERVSPLNVCQVGHTTHESKVVQTAYGLWHIWQWDKYQWQGAYCTGQDEVSKSIEITGWWEKPDTDHMFGILGEKAGVMLDFGSHLGWFSVLAAESGCSVMAIEADPENCRLFETNWTNRGVQPHLTLHNEWAADATWIPAFTPDLRFMKVDIEGHEHEALNLTRHLWQQQKIDYGLWELSPIFENREGINAPSYAALVDEIASYGYRWYILKGDDRWYIEGKDLTFPQENAWCEKV